MKILPIIFKEPFLPTNRLSFGTRDHARDGLGALGPAVVLDVVHPGGARSFAGANTHDRENSSAGKLSAAAPNDNGAGDEHEGYGFEMNPMATTTDGVVEGRYPS